MVKLSILLDSYINQKKIKDTKSVMQSNATSYFTINY